MKTKWSEVKSNKLMRYFTLKQKNSVFLFRFDAEKFKLKRNEKNLWN